MAKYDTVVFIGRFQPIHLGHLAVIKAGLDHLEANGQLAVMVGSADRARSARDPLTFEERAHLIAETLREQLGGERSVEPATGNPSVLLDNAVIAINPLPDDPYNNSLWIESVQGLVKRDGRTALIGHAKDHTSYYLKMFPQWDSISVDNHQQLNSTAIREAAFAGGSVDGLQTADCVKRFLRQFADSDQFTALQGEQEFVTAYRKSWEAAPYAPTLVTVDAVMVQAGHVALVKRGGMPGQGLGALPGGFIEQHEKISDSLVREVYEEIRPDLPAPLFRERIKGVQVYDDPNRDLRGRVITHAFYVDLDGEISRSVSQEKRPELTRLKAGDDAAKATWIALRDLVPNKMYGDHFHIIRDMVRRFGGEA